MSTSTFFSQVRRAAQQGVCSILRGSDFLFADNAPTHHPAAAATAKFCIKEVEQAGGKATLSLTYIADVSICIVWTDAFFPLR